MTYSHSLNLILFIISGDDQGYRGLESLFVKYGNHIYLTIQNSYYGDEHKSTCYNYRLSQQEIKDLRKFE